MLLITGATPNQLLGSATTGAVIKSAHSPSATSFGAGGYQNITLKSENFIINRTLFYWFRSCLRILVNFSAP